MKKYYVCTRSIETRDQGRVRWENEFPVATEDKVAVFDTPEKARAEFVKRGFNTPDTFAKVGNCYVGQLRYLEEIEWEDEEDFDEFTGTIIDSEYIEWVEPAWGENDD